MVGIALKEFAFSISVDVNKPYPILLISGKDCMVHNFKIKKTLESFVDSCEVKISKEYDGYVKIGLIARLYWKGNLLFAGYVRKKERKGAYLVVEVLSYGEELMNTYVFRNYENKYIHEIVNDLISETNLNIGEIQQTNIKLERWICRESIIENLKKLAIVLNYDIWTDVNKNFYFKQRGIDISTYTFSRQNSNILSIKQDTTKLANDILIKGGEVRNITVDSFTGDGSTKEFTLTYKPLDVKVSIDGSLVSRSEYEIKEEQKKIIFNTAPASGSSIEVEYSYFYPITIRLQNKQSIGKYGRYFKVLELKWLKTQGDIVNYGTSYLNKFAEPLYQIKLERKFDFDEVVSNRPGMLVQFQDNIYNIDTKLEIVGMEIEMTKITYYLSSYVGDILLTQAEIMERIKELERRLSSEEVITLYAGISEEAEVSESESMESGSVVWKDSFILGDAAKSDIDSTPLSGYKYS